MSGSTVNGQTDIWWEEGTDYSLGSATGQDYAIELRFFTKAHPAETTLPYATSLTFSLTLIDPRCQPSFTLPSLIAEPYNYFISNDSTYPSVIDLTGALNGNCKFSLSVTANSIAIDDPSMQDSTGN